MAIQSIWLQNVAYPARIDRLALQELFGGRELVVRGLVVTQHATGDATVDISVGAVTILGDDQANQGLYLEVLDAASTSFAVPAVPGANKRIDLLSMRVNDPQAGGPVGNNGSLVVTSGAVAATPIAPAVPTSAVPLAQILRTAGDPAILASMITDVAPRGLWPYTITTAAPPATLPQNYLWVQVA